MVMCIIFFRDDIHLFELIFNYSFAFLLRMTYCLLQNKLSCMYIANDH